MQRQPWDWKTFREQHWSPRKAVGALLLNALVLFMIVCYSGFPIKEELKINMKSLLFLAFSWYGIKPVKHTQTHCATKTSAFFHSRLKTKIEKWFLNFSSNSFTFAVSFPSALSLCLSLSLSLFFFSICLPLCLSLSFLFLSVSFYLCFSFYLSIYLYIFISLCLVIRWFSF